MLGFRREISARSVVGTLGTVTMIIALVLSRAHAAGPPNAGMDCPVYCHYCDQYGRIAAFAAPFGNDPGGETACSWGVCLDCGGLAHADLDAVENVEQLPLLDQFRLLRRLDNIVIADAHASLRVIGCDGEVAANIPVSSRRTIALAKLAGVDIAN